MMEVRSGSIFFLVRVQEIQEVKGIRESGYKVKDSRGAGFRGDNIGDGG